jgi:Ca2+-binding RTX toxin-like protein
VVTGLVGDISATALSGSLTVTTGDAGDDGISITTGSGTTSINASGSGDTVTTNAAALAQDTTLTLSGTANQTVTDLVGDTAAANSSGTLTITTGDAADNGISIATGSNNAYINGTASSDTLSIDAAALAESSTLNLQGSSAVVVSNLVGDLYGYQAISSQNTETFDTAAGWTNGTIYSGSSYYGNVLGLYASGPKTNGQDTYKTINFGGQATTLSFDLAKNDSWDDEKFRVYIDDTLAFEKSFRYNLAIDSASGTTNSYAWTIAPKDSPGYYAGLTNWRDQTAIVTIAIPAGRYNTKIGFGSNLDEAAFTNESYAIDNLTVPTSSTTTLSGPLTVTTGDAADNAINIVTGTANATINATGTDDTVTVNANAMADNTTLDLNGSSTFTVTNLEANTDAAGSSGVVTLTYKDVADNAASIITGSADTTVVAAASSDQISIAAGAMADDALLTLSGASSFVVDGLRGDLNASVTTSSPLTIGLADGGDNHASVVVGTGNVVLSGGDGTDTITVTGLNTNNQTLSASTSSANFNIIAGAGSQTITGSNTGSDIIDAGAGTDTLTYAGGNQVDLAATDYLQQAGGSSGQGQDEFRGIEVLVGSAGADVLRGIEDSSDEIAIIQNANAGTLADRSATGSFQFSSFESLDLNAGNDTLTLLNDASMAGFVDGGDGIDTLDYTQYTSSGVTVDLGMNIATALGQGLVMADGHSSFENVDGTAFADTLIGDSYGNVLRGFGGSDTIHGGAGDNTIDGGDGSKGADGSDLIAGGDGADFILGSDGSDFISGGGYTNNAGFYSIVADAFTDTLSYSDENEGIDLSLSGTDSGTVKADADASLSISSFTSTYANQLLISVPTNQVSTDWIDTYGDIQNLELTDQNDIVRLDPTDVSTGTINARGGKLDTLDYSTFDATKPVLVNLSDAAYSFDFDNNRLIDTARGEITIANANSATNVMVDQASSQGGANGISGFEVVIGGAADDAIVGNAADNLLVGNDGNDRIAGGAGNDTIYGGAGDDFIVPGAGVDIVFGGSGINVISITSDDLREDTFSLESQGINVFRLDGVDSGGAPITELQAKSGYWNPGDDHINLIDGGDPIVNKTTGETNYDGVIGTDEVDIYDFSKIALKNISSVDLGTDDDWISTSATTKGIKVNYHGGTHAMGDTIILNFTFDQFVRLNQANLYVADVQSYLDNPDGNDFDSLQGDFSASGFEFAGVNVISPAVYNELQGDPLAITFNDAYGIYNSQITSGQDLALSAAAATTSTAAAASVADIVSALVQANNVKGAEKVQLTAGGSLTGASSASQLASATATTVDDRSDAALAAYALGVDRSSFTSGNDLSLSISGQVDATTLGQSLGYVVKANSTVETAGSRDSSFSAGDDLNLTLKAAGTQDVQASNGDGLAAAGLASRAYGIDDANLTDASSDAVSAGGNLNLTATAQTTNRVAASTINSEDLGSISLAPGFDFTTTLTGTQFPLIEGDRLRFTTSSSDGGIQANRDYFVLNPQPGLGKFQLASLAGSDDPILITTLGGLQMYRPAVATADGLSTATGVDLSSTIGVEAGSNLQLVVTASDQFSGTATSVAGDATAGLNRLGGPNNLDVLPVSTVVALSDTTSVSGGSAKVSSVASDAADLQATSTLGDALSEGNVQVLGSDSSSINAGADLTTMSSASLRLIAAATSTAGRADSRSGSGAGAGSSIGGNGNAAPDASTYGLVSAVTDSSQGAGADLALQANATAELTASAKTVGGSTTLSSLWSKDNVLSTFDPNATGIGATPSLIGPQYLADGQEVQLDAANASALGLDDEKEYVVRLLATTSVDTSDTGPTANTLTMPTGITYSNGDAIRFRLNSTTVSNASSSRYGLELGTTYYVKTSSPTPTSTFQLSTTSGGAGHKDLTPDISGLEDQLVDADRFQLLEPPALPGGAYTVASLTPVAIGGLSVILPSESTAFAGSRQAGITLAAPSALAQLNAIDGSGLAATGVMSLLSGASSTITAFADGVLNALSRNVGSDATASAGLNAEGIRDTAITAGSDGTVNSRATINAVAEASTTGDNALLDNSLANLNVSATGLSASAADQDISIGGVGDVQSTASLAGRSTASTVLGDSDALAALQATGLEALSNGFTATIGQQGDISAAASIGSLAAPLLISALSSAEGDATAQAAAAALGILGTYNAGFSSLQAGTSQGDISGTASADLTLSAIATNGIASVTLADVPGTGRASITGIENMALTAGAGLSSVDATAVGRANLSARSVELDASSSGSTSTTGVFSSTVAALPISFAEDGRIAAIAQQSSFAQSVTVNGNASTSLNNTSLGIGNATITIAGDGSFDARALSQLESRSQSVAGDARA